jgi:hypothetical protein
MLNVAALVDPAGQVSILWISISSETFSDKFLAMNCGQKFIPKLLTKMFLIILDKFAWLSNHIVAPKSPF